MADYVLWVASTRVKNACVLGDMRGFQDIYDLKSGVSFVESFPPDVEFEMNPDFPDNIVLTDNLINEEGLIVGSGKLKQFLESRGANRLEYLAVSIRDHKGRIASKDYYVLNPIDPVECLDDESSVAEPSLILPDEIDSVQTLVLNVERIDPKREIFRIARFPIVTVVHRRLAEAIDQQGFTGVRWLELSDYPEV